MKEIKGNLWDYYDKGYTICITTNGFIKKNGENVMGAGCALEAAERYPELPKHYGTLLKDRGIRLVSLRERMIAFPVKWNWYEKADIELIKKSCNQLIKANMSLQETIILPRPGSGAGGLDWETDVKPNIKDLLDDNIWVISF